MQVGWANASLRHLQQLPAIPDALGTGVFQEDPVTAGMAPHVRATLDRAALQRLRDGGLPSRSFALRGPSIVHGHFSWRTDDGERSACSF